MKKVILLIAFITAPIIGSAQSIFDKLEDMDGVESVIVNKEAFEILSKFKIDGGESEVMEAFKMIQDLKELKVFSTKEASVANTMDDMVSKAVKNSNLIELMRIKENDSRVKIYIKSGKNKDFVNEVLMFVKGIDKRTNGMSESVVVSLTGNIDINKMSEIVSTFASDNNIEIKTNKKN